MAAFNGLLAAAITAANGGTILQSLASGAIAYTATQLAGGNEAGSDPFGTEDEMLKHIVADAAGEEAKDTVTQDVVKSVAGAEKKIALVQVRFSRSSGWTDLLLPRRRASV